MKQTKLDASNQMTWIISRDRVRSGGKSGSIPALKASDLSPIQGFNATLIKH